jgi:hypothetical protein
MYGIGQQGQVSGKKASDHFSCGYAQVEENRPE